MSLKWRQDAEQHKSPLEQHNIGAVQLGLINVHIHPPSLTKLMRWHSSAALFLFAHERDQILGLGLLSEALFIRYLPPLGDAHRFESQASFRACLRSTTLTLWTHEHDPVRVDLSRDSLRCFGGAGWGV